MSIYTKIKALFIAILMGVSPITYSAEEILDGEKQTNKKNLSTVSSNSAENAQLTKNQKLQHAPLEMSDYIPNDICSLFFHFLTGKPLEESNFILTCKNWKAAADGYYKKINVEKQIHQWQGDTLHNRTLNIFNVHMLTVLGLSMSTELTNKKDAAIFKQRCEHITRAPFFKYEAIPIKYARLLLLRRESPNILEMPREDLSCLENKIRSLKDDLTQELTHIANNNSLCTQNESYIYFDFTYQFHNDGYSNIKSSSLFSKINFFFGRILNEELLDLKKTPNLDDSSQFAHTWKKIMKLEPTPTLWMLKKASSSVYQKEGLNGFAYYLAYRKALKPIEKITSKEKEIGSNWCEMAANALKKKTGSTPEEFENLGGLCEELEAYVDAGECYFEALKMKENLQKKPTPDDYKKLGKYMVEHEANSLASHVYLSAFKTILSLEQIPTPEDCKNVIDLVTDSQDAGYGEEALLLFQQRIKYIENLGQTPSSEDYLDLKKIHMCTAYLYHRRCRYNNTSLENGKILNQFSNHVTLALKTMALANQNPELKDYLGVFYSYSNECIYSILNITMTTDLEAEHHYQNLKSSGLEIPEEVKNWGENLENYYSSAQEFRQQSYQQISEGQLEQK